jgi:hypothetical protein
MKKMNNYLDCPCLSASPIEKQYLLKEFESIREKCPALREILIPDNVWPKFREMATNSNEAKHYPILLLALQCGYLKKITSPVHKYLLENGKTKKQFKKEYRKDLIEKWMIPKDESKPKDEMKRHQESRGYLGKLIELQIAEWLEDQGWKVDNLEALCGELDIEASSPEGIEYAFEIKSIGQEDDKFLAVVESAIPAHRFKSLIKRLYKDREEDHIKRLVEKCKSRTFDPYSGSNFVLFRAYEAAKQLKQSPKQRIAIIVISNMSWSFLQIPINEDWMNWHSPCFLESCFQWQDFFEQNKERYPEIETDLKEAITSLTELWIVIQGNNFEYSLNRKINFD